MKTLECMLCGNRSLVPFGSFDLRASNESTLGREGEHSLLVECTRCGVVCRDNFSSEELTSEYEETYYSGTVILEEHIKYLYLLRWQKIKSIFSRFSKILDFGCGKGYFLHQLRSVGLGDIHGVELNQSALGFLKEQGYDVGKEFSELKSPGPYDIISLFHVLEHLEDPRNFLESLKDSLQENGRIIIEVPNIDSYGFRKYGSDWFYLQQEHLYYFNPKSLLALLENTGYKVEKCYRFGGFIVTKGRSDRDKMLAIPSGLKKPMIRVYLLICDLLGRHDFIGVVARK